MEIKPYIHKVKYYETDRMGITHHSNYIRWMEEARLDFLEQIGWGYDKIEAEGIISPVTGVDCKYMLTTTFPDEIEIRVAVEDFKGVRLKILYEMRNQEGKIVCKGHSEHCFLDANGKIMKVNRQYPELYDALRAFLVEKE